MFVYIRSAAFVIVVTQKLVLQQSKTSQQSVLKPYCPLLLFNSPWEKKIYPVGRYIMKKKIFLFLPYSSLIGGALNEIIRKNYYRLTLVDRSEFDPWWVDSFSSLVNQKSRFFIETMSLISKKEFSFCHKFECSNPYTFLTWWCKLSLFQT